MPSGKSSTVTNNDKQTGTERVNKNTDERSTVIPEVLLQEFCWEVMEQVGGVRSSCKLL